MIASRPYPPIDPCNPNRTQGSACLITSACGPSSFTARWSYWPDSTHENGSQPHNATGVSRADPGHTTASRQPGQEAHGHPGATRQGRAGRGTGIGGDLGARGDPGTRGDPRGGGDPHGGWGGSEDGGFDVAAPASRRVAAAPARVPPVVARSSTGRTRPPARRYRAVGGGRVGGPRSGRAARRAPARSRAARRERPRSRPPEGASRPTMGRSRAAATPAAIRSAWSLGRPATRPAAT